jgi:glycosyltransferase involved in cell wall biosynthesis
MGNYSCFVVDLDATVLISTRNRADHIAASLTSVLTSAKRTPFDVEVLVVNNASEDHTARVLEAFSAVSKIPSWAGPGCSTEPSNW